MSNPAAVVIREVRPYGTTQYLAGIRQAGKSRTSSFCRHYHDTEADARQCVTLGNLRAAAPKQMAEGCSDCAELGAPCGR